MSTDKNLTVCIVTRNEEGRIAACLESLLPCDGEILVIDNGSTDRTLEIVSRYPQVQVLQNPENNLGLARARAVERASTRWIAFIDADCIAPPAWAERLQAEWAKHAKADPRLAAVGGGNRPPEAQGFYHSLRLMLSSVLGHLHAPQAFCPRQNRKVSHLPTCNVIYARSAVLAVGNFSPRFKKVCEDLELNHRLTKAGYSLYQVAGLEVEHFHQPGLSAWARKMFRYGRGQIHVMQEHPAHLLGIKSLPLIGAATGLALLASAPRAAVFALALYFGVVIVYSGALVLLRSPRRSAGAFAQLIGLFAITHFSYTCGELWGLIERKTR